MSSRSGIACLLLAATLAAGCDRKSPSPEQANSVQASAATADEVTSGEATASAPAAPAAGTVDRTHKGEAAPATAFASPDGKSVTLATFKGKPMLLNLWATWCAPCVKEMPTLDAAAATLDGTIVVLPVAQDLDGKAKVDAFFAKAKFAHLKPYFDAKAALSLGYRANLPTTILFDATGHEMWRVSGEMDWTSAPARALLAEAR